MRQIALVSVLFFVLLLCPYRNAHGLKEAVEHVEPETLLILMRQSNWESPKTELDRAVADLVVAVAKNERKKILRTQEALVRHRWTSVIAFTLAHMLIIVSLVLGTLEFRQANQLRRQGRKADKLEVSISLEGIALKGSFNGLLLLLISFGFYFAFLCYVYPLVAI